MNIPALIAFISRRGFHPETRQSVAPIIVGATALNDFLHHGICLFVRKLGKKGVASKRLEPAEEICSERGRPLVEFNVTRVHAVVFKQLRRLALTCRIRLPQSTVPQSESTKDQLLLDRSHVDEDSHVKHRAPQR